MAGDTATAVSDNGTGPAVLQGIMAWTGTGALWGVTAAVRAANPAFLSISIVDCTASGLGLATVRQSISLGVAQMATVSGHPKDAYCSPSLWFRLSEELQSQGMYTGAKGQGPSGEGSFGFSSLVMPTPTGDVEVSMDPQAMSYLPYSTYGVGYSGANIVYRDEDALSPLAHRERVRDLFGDAPFETQWSNLFKIHRRHAQRFVVGRVILAGDAAHLNSPAGRQRHERGDSRCR